MPADTPLVVEIDVSVGPASPCDEDGWKLYSFARDKFVTDVDPERFVKAWDPRSREVTPATPGLRRKLDRGLAFWLSYAEHGDCKWSLKGEGSSDLWDSTTLAGVLVWEWKVDDLGPKTPEARAADARTFLDTYTDWANGYVYDWTVREWGSDEALESGREWVGTDDMLAAIRKAVGTRPVIAEGDCGWMLRDTLYTGQPALRVVDPEEFALTPAAKETADVG